MNCHRCGNILPTNANVCTSCYRTPDKTRVLQEADANLHKTRPLVHMDRCDNCGFLIYSSDTECQACGTWVDRSWKTKTPTPPATKTAIKVAMKIPIKTPKIAKAAEVGKNRVGFGKNPGRWMFGVTAGVVTSVFILIMLFIILKG